MSCDVVESSWKSWRRDRQAWQDSGLSYLRGNVSTPGVSPFNWSLTSHAGLNCRKCWWLDVPGVGNWEPHLYGLQKPRRECGETILLDIVTSSDTARLYERLGWVRAGGIPDYALWPHGGHCSTTFISA